MIQLMCVVLCGLANPFFFLSMLIVKQKFTVQFTKVDFETVEINPLLNVGNKVIKIFVTFNANLLKKVHIVSINQSISKHQKEVVMIDLAKSQ